MGVSGGKKGARLGPAIMPGGDRAAYESVRSILEGIAARAGEKPCCTYIGEDGAGHYVKMVHNGIEYADMQLIAETYLILKHVGGLSNARIGEIFHAWNSGELRSYLIGITADIFAEQDAETGAALVDIIVDRAGQKGAGCWTSLEALARGVDLSMISAACNARVLSNLTEERAHAGAVMTAPEGGAVTVDADFIEAVRRSLYTAKIVAYAQGFSLYRAAKEEFGWSLDFGKIASIAAVIRIACGSATVAALTACGIAAPVVALTGVSPELMVIATGAGSLIISPPNDPGFWLFKEFFGLTVKETVRTWCALETIISVMGLAGVLILEAIIA